MEPQKPPHPKDLIAGHRMRMKCKLHEMGPESLSHQELLEMILYLSFKRGDVKPVVKALFHQFDTLGNILNASETELKSISGVGPAVIDLFALLKTIYFRLDQGEMKRHDVLSNWEAVVNFTKHRLGHEKIEKFMVIYLNSQNIVVDDEIMSTGTINKTAIFPREIVRAALRRQAAAVIIVHNHPTGTLRPSHADIEMTHKIQAALATVDVTLHDHLILGGNETVSFKSMGLLS